MSFKRKNGYRPRLIPILPALLLAILTWFPPSYAANIPALNGRVNDYAGLLSPRAVAVLEAKLSDLEKTDSTQIVVLTVPSLQGDALENFSMRVAEAWKIGQKSKDNGAILLIAKKERKIRIEVGYGLEGRLTDMVSGQIIRNIINPAFRAGDFDRGVIDGVDAMTAAVRGEYKDTGYGRRHMHGHGPSGEAISSLVVFIFFLFQIGRFSRSVGTVMGGILVPLFGVMFFPLSGLLILALIPVGLAAGFIVSFIGAAMAASSGVSDLRGGYRGGAYWGGGSSGGGFGGGGFGGFSGGGGGFGGGGASGGW